MRSAHNLGYAGAINALIDRLQYVVNWDGVWILNPDTEPDPRALAELVARAKTANKGMVGSTIVPKAAGGRVHCRGGLRWCTVTSRAILLGFDDRVDAPIDVARIEAEMDSPSGASMFVTRACLKQIGPMDEQFFLYYEDLDWGIRAKSFGLGYAATSIIVHKGGTAIGSSSTNRRKRSWLSTYLESRNRILFVRKHYPRRILLAHVFLLLYAFRYILTGSYKGFGAALEGWFAGIIGEVGAPTRLPPEFLVLRRSGKTLPLVRREENLF
jgi:GT2 family glycosyltransferase